nr:immunoglobulin heavy chain junction region [Macaca mulatta]MOW76263.1 immunoglobulin heavy chain junction region [Macaca mulatta]MOW76329.1 immunoglobulin heavy chain junction region [Macaca mulatta]MOW76566.1 immunoglobulin heavy chain junction region [Macaca mulatta]MOW81673.1 immunoglobulin heavy chain junction region [Macaca mulatta]
CARTEIYRSHFIYFDYW